MFGQKSKALAVAEHIFNHAKGLGYTLTPMQLLKLVYVAHGWMLGKHGKPLFTEPVLAWQYGPVVPSVYQAVKGYGSAVIQCVSGAPQIAFDTDEIAIMDFVSQNYARVDGITLSSATHQPGTPWSQTWASRPQSSPISNDLIQNYYQHLMTLPSHSSL